MKNADEVNQALPSTEPLEESLQETLGGLSAAQIYLARGQWQVPDE